MEKNKLYERKRVRLFSVTVCVRVNLETSSNISLQLKFVQEGKEILRVQLAVKSKHDVYD